MLIFGLFFNINRLKGGVCVSLGDLCSVYAVLIIKAETLLMNRREGNRLQTLEKHWTKITYYIFGMN